MAALSVDATKAGSTVQFNPEKGILRVRDRVFHVGRLKHCSFTKKEVRCFSKEIGQWSLCDLTAEEVDGFVRAILQDPNIRISPGFTKCSLSFQEERMTCKFTEVNPSFLPVLKAIFPGEEVCHREEIGDFIWVAPVGKASGIIAVNEELKRFDLAIKIPNVEDSSLFSPELIKHIIEENPIEDCLEARAVQEGESQVMAPPSVWDTRYELSSESGLIIRIDLLIKSLRRIPKEISREIEEISRKIEPLVTLLEGYNKMGSLPEGAPQKIKECILDMRKGSSLRKCWLLMEYMQLYLPESAFGRGTFFSDTQLEPLRLPGALVEQEEVKNFFRSLDLYSFFHVAMDSHLSPLHFREDKTRLKPFLVEDGPCRRFLLKEGLSIAFEKMAEPFEKAFQQKFDIQQKILGKRLEPAEEKRE